MSAGVENSTRGRNRAVPLALALAASLAAILALAAPALADTVDVAEYRARLVQARALVSAGRAGEAQDVLRRTTAVRVDDAIVSVDDAPLADRLSSVDRADALGDLDARVADADRALMSPHDAARADAALRDLLVQDAPAAIAGSFTALVVALVRRAFDALGRPDVLWLQPLQIAAGIALAAVLAAIVVRGVRERLRVEVALPELRRGDRSDASSFLRAAEEAARRGDRRSAIHLWYRYAFAALDARDAFPYDPTLTDRELLARAAAVPHVGALRDLVALHDRVWFGLREAGADDASRAGSLARRVAA